MTTNPEPRDVHLFTESGTAEGIREILYWSLSQHEEELQQRSIEDAIDPLLGDLVDGKPVPETVTVYGWARVATPDPSDFIAWWGPLEGLLDRIDEEHGDPREGTDPTDSMREAERAFVQAVLDEYEVWSCEVVTERVVRLRDYLEWQEARKNDGGAA